MTHATSAEHPRRSEDIVGGWRRHELDRSAAAIDISYAQALGEDTPLRAATAVAEGGRLRALDVGCGTGNFLRTLAGLVLLQHPDAAVRLVGINDEDFRDESMSSKTRRAIREGQIQYDVGRAEELPYPNNSFDFVHSYEVMYRTDAPEAQLREMVRVTAPAGHVFCDFNVQAVLTERQPMNRLLGYLARDGYEINEEAITATNAHLLPITRTYLHLTAPS